jgi:formate/nitrite transporter FocA (FNT family)
MKLETLLLQIVFSACLLLCVLTMGTMFTSHAPVTTASAMTTTHVLAVAMAH